MSAFLAAVLLAATTRPAPAASPLAAAASTGEGAREVTVSEGLRAAPRSPRGIRVMAIGRAGESWAELARRLTGRFANAEAIRHGDPDRAPAPGRGYEVAFELLLPALRREVVAALLPQDRCEGSLWVHAPRPGFPADASYETLAAWFSAGSEGAAALESALRRSARPDASQVRIPCVGIGE